MTKQFVNIVDASDLHPLVILLWRMMRSIDLIEVIVQILSGWSLAARATRLVSQQDGVSSSCPTRSDQQGPQGLGRHAAGSMSRCCPHRPVLLHLRFRLDTRAGGDSGEAFVSSF
ncbi:hypothetical protein E4U46_004494 [Claviceps purpurea]|nr:hypothetical protein E4U46_004494 [Claviceps purpurea]